MNRRALAKAGTISVTAWAVAQGTGATQGTPAVIDASPVDGAMREVVHPRGTTLVPAAPQRVVNLGEEWLLADLLELGVRPVATSATYVDGFVGIDTDYEPEIPLFTTFEMDIEAMIALQPDLIISQDYLFDLDESLYDNLSQLAPVVSVADSDVWEENVLTLAAIFGKEAEATDIIAALEAEIAATATNLDLSGQTVSFATVYPGGDGFALWVTNANPIVDVAITLGATVLPDAANFETDMNGRAWLSLEQVSEVQGDTLIMLQTLQVEAQDEVESYEEVTSGELWQTIPAVQNDRVFVLERVGYPGEVSGRRRLLAEYVTIFG